MKGIPQRIFPTAFSSHSSAPLFIYAIAYRVLGMSSSFLKGKSCVSNCLPKIETQTHVAGTLCYASSLSRVQLGLEPGQKPQGLVSRPNEAQVLDVLMSHYKKFSERHNDR